MIGRKLTAYFSTFLLLFCFVTDFSKADPLDNWHWRNPIPAGQWLYGVAYGGGIFVVVGEKGIFFTSSDGANWVPRNLGIADDFIGVTYGQGIFIALGRYGTILNSFDGITWYPSEFHPKRPLSRITYANGTFIAV